MILYCDQQMHNYLKNYVKHLNYKLYYQQMQMKYRGADKSLAQQGRKQATATKL